MPEFRPTPYSPLAYLDAHVHLWDIAAVSIPWFRPELDLPERVTAMDLARADTTGVAAVAVQAANTRAEFDWLDAQRTGAERPMRLVGQYEPSPQGWAGVLQPRRHRLAGLRLAAGSARSDLTDIAGVDRLAEGLSTHGLVLELLVRPDQLAAAAELTARHPGLTVVLCHLGLGGADPDPPWRQALAAYAAQPNAHAKVSGIIRPHPHGSVAGRSDDRLRTVVMAAREAFGDDRLIFGSDWPMSARIAVHEHIVTATADAWGEDADTAEGFWGGTARRLYGF